MSARVHGESTAANVIQQTPIKMRGSEKNDNVPAKQTITRIQNLTHEIKEKQKDVQKESDKVQEMLDNQDLNTLDQRQLNMVVKSLSQQVKELSDQVQDTHEQLQAAGLLPQSTIGHDSDTDESVGSPVPGTGTGMIACYGYQAQAEEALNALTTQLMKLQNLVRELNVSILDSQRGKDVNGTIQGGTLSATANAIMTSADKDADISIQERNKCFAQIGSSVVNMGATAALQYKTQSELNAPEGASTKLNEMNNFKMKLEEAEPLGPAHGDDEEAPQLSDEQKERMQALSEGAGRYRYQDGDDEILGHIKGGDDIPGDDGVRKGLRASTRGHLADAMHQAELERNSAYTQMQTRTQMVNTVTQMGDQSAQAAFNSYQADDKREKGYADAMQQLAKYSNDQFSSASSAQADQAKQYDQTAAEVNRAKQSVNNQSSNG